LPEKLIGISETAELLGTNTRTLRRWDAEGKLEAVRTLGGHRRYRLSDIEALQGIDVDSRGENEDCVVVYCRVSSHEQKKKGDLDRQKGRVLERCVKKGYKVRHVLEEVSSGMNDRRNKLKRLFRLVQDRKVNRVVIEHKDRLARFMFNIFVEFFDSHGVEIECIEEVLSKTYEAELVEDVLSLMSSFSAKIYGRCSVEIRRKTKRKKRRASAKGI